MCGILNDGFQSGEGTRNANFTTYFSRNPFHLFPGFDRNHFSQEFGFVRCNADQPWVAGYLARMHRCMLLYYCTASLSLLRHLFVCAKHRASRLLVKLNLSHCNHSPGGIALDHEKPWQASYVPFATRCFKHFTTSTIILSRISQFRPFVLAGKSSTTKAFGMPKMLLLQVATSVICCCGRFQNQIRKSCKRKFDTIITT
jgi:hypothetical protein